ncbi:ankyrin repeat domain-containing protein [bacterium]|nr:ankyrin repeat domain-containing protein [bacterium]
MKHILITTIAAVMLVGCGNPEADRALFNAASGGNIEAVKQHLTAGTDVEVKDNNGFTPLHIATREVAELLIAEGADVNAKGLGGSTPLHLAAMRGHKETAELLIAKGAAVNAKDVNEYTPRDWATHPDNPNASAEIADLLRKHGGKTGEELKAEGK